MITLNNVSFTYEGGNQPALSDITIEVPDGDFLGIIGESGAGKTTLTHMINGVVPHFYKGDYYGNVSVKGLDPVVCGLEELSRIVGTVFQDVDAGAVSSEVEDELLFGLENFGVPHDQIASRIDEALSMTGVSELRGRTLASLSGGQKQRVAIAAVLALKPEMLLLDEPTGELDPAGSRMIFILLAELNRTGVTVVIVEQKIMLLCEFAKTLAVMEKGRLMLHGPVREVLEERDTLERCGVNMPRVLTLAASLRELGGPDIGVCVTSAEAERKLRTYL